MVRVGFFEFEPEGKEALASVAGITPTQVGELFEIISGRFRFRSPAVGDPIQSWELQRVHEIWADPTFPIAIAKIDTGVDSEGCYRDLYHIEGTGWFYRLRVVPDLMYPEEREGIYVLRPNHHDIYEKWDFAGEVEAFARQMVETRLLLD